MDEIFAQSQRDDSLQIRLSATVGADQDCDAVLEPELGSIPVAGDVGNRQAAQFHAPPFMSRLGEALNHILALSKWCRAVPV